MENLRAKAKWWMREKSDVHMHDTTHRPPLELFMEQETMALQPLPLHPYDSCEVALRVCRFDGFIEFETNFYSVPYPKFRALVPFAAPPKIGDPIKTKP